MHTRSCGATLRGPEWPLTRAARQVTCGRSGVGGVAKRVLNLAENADAAAAGDQDVAGSAGLDADRLAGTNPIVSTALDADDLVIGDLDPKLVPRLAAVQPETVRIELQPTVEGDAAVPPEHRIARHAHKLARIDRDDIRANH